MSANKPGVAPLMSLTVKMHGGVDSAKVVSHEMTREAAS
jgi:hypothetical protein